MVDFQYLAKGLSGLARAHRASIMAGHLGAAVVTGYFFGEDQPDLDERVYAGIGRELERILHGEESWFDPKKAGVTVAELFEPFPDEPSREGQIERIVTALANNIGELHESGHNVIFASIAIRAIADHPRYATPSMVEGICKLIAGFDGTYPGRGYYGAKRGWMDGDQVSLPDDDRSAPYRDEAAMVEVVMDELIRTGPVRRQGFGGLWHLINHAAALIELGAHGYRDLARKGMGAHLHHLRLWRSLPDVEEELGPVKRADHDPRTPEFWAPGKKMTRDAARLTHRVKTLYGFYRLLRFVPDPKTRAQADEAFLYLMA